MRVATCAAIPTMLVFLFPFYRSLANGHLHKFPIYNLGVIIIDQPLCPHTFCPIQSHQNVLFSARKLLLVLLLFFSEHSFALPLFAPETVNRPTRRDKLLSNACPSARVPAASGDDSYRRL
uniref:(northern house mosquito) hypothetical protein n=1 Tax=Culex pipiens TaxID=7175 RepID=A0A8D8CV84_CULPI